MAVSTEHGWTTTQTLMLLAALLILGLLLLPSIASRLITSRTNDRQDEVSSR
ncbi:hypothetical protein ACRAWF_20590 [Streptomyces sp. L7]